MDAGELDRIHDRPMGRVGLARGLIVIAAAVLVGSFILMRGAGEGDDTTLAASEAPSTTDEAADDLEGTVDEAGPATGSDGATAPGGTGTGQGSTDPTVGGAVQEPVTPGEDDEPVTGPDEGAAPGDTITDPSGPSTPNGVTVLVLNGGAAKGIAGRGTELLKAAGYTMLPPRNSDVVEPSAVLHVGGREADALAVASALDVDAGSLVDALDPADPPIGDYGTADVIVVIGPDGLIDVSGG